MLALLAAIALTQAEPLTSDAPALETLTPPPMLMAPRVVERKARFFTSPRVSSEVLLGRTGMAMLLGAIGGGIGVGLIGIGHLIGVATKSPAPVLISLPFAIGALGMATAIGAALFGDDFGRDLGDAMGVALMSSLISVVFAVSFWFLAPITVVTAVVVSLAFVTPAILTPLTVQSYKPDDGPTPAVPLMSF